MAKSLYQQYQNTKAGINMVIIRPNNVPKYEQAEKLFKDGMSLRKISKEVKLDYRYISRYLKSKGYQIKRNQQWVKDHSLELDEAVELFELGFGIKTISSRLSIADYLISEHFEKLGIHPGINNQKYTYYYDVFENIDTEEKAYWLGFLSADGSIHNDIIELNLKESDSGHVEKFAKFISPDLQGHFKPQTNSYRVSVCSKKISNDLYELGVTPNKSLTLKFCDKVPKELLHHYIRGYIDGDGTIFIRKDGQAVFEVLGTQDFVDHIEESLELHHNKNGQHGQAKSIRYSGNKQVKSILDKVYKNATIYLERKYEIYQSIRPSRSSVKVDELLVRN